MALSMDIAKLHVISGMFFNSMIVSYNGIITTKNQHHWSRGTGKATFKIDWASILVIRSVPFFK